MNSIRLSLFVLTLALIWPHNASATQAVDESRLDQAGRIKLRAAAGDYQALLALAAEYKRECVDFANYADLIDQVATALENILDFEKLPNDSTPIFREELRSKAVQFREDVLLKADDMPVGTELRLALKLLRRFLDCTYNQTPVVEDRVKLRTKKLELVFHAWGRLEREIDRNFDFTAYYPSLNNAVGAHNPDKAPEQWEAEREKRRKYNLQRDLRSVEDLFLPFIQDYVVEAYSKPPYNTKELQEHLEKNIPDKTKRDLILSQVNEKIGKAAKATK